jgi:hypothetical protein
MNGLTDGERKDFRSSTACGCGGGGGGLSIS